jgi:hypothetical protein
MAATVSVFDLLGDAPRRAVAQGPTLHTRPEYAAMLPEWTVLAHAYCSAGGFADGGYLVPHKREWLDWQNPFPSRPSPGLIARRRLARYENLAAKIANVKHGALTRAVPTRQVRPLASGAPHPITAWWNDVDGTGTPIDDFMANAELLALVLGYVVLFVDVPGGPGPLTLADTRRPYVCSYLPSDVPDWVAADRQLTGIRLLEAAPRTSIEQAVDFTRPRSRIVSRSGWKVIDGGAVIDQGTWAFDAVPAVYLYATPHPFAPFMGQSALGPSRMYLDDYNLTSEAREIKRAQVFAVFNVELGSGPDATPLDKAKAMLGDQIGPHQVLFTPGAARWLSPDPASLESYRVERERLQRTLFRLADIPWESDSRDAESEGSLRLKREDLNLALAGYADQMEKADYALAQWFFRWTYGARWQEEWEAAEVTIRYPDSFDPQPFEELLQQAQAALTLDMPAVFLAEMKKRLVPQFLVDAPPDTVAAINAAIEATKDDTPQSRARARLTDALSRVSPPPEEGAAGG